jgi:hypothetical protein
MSKSYICRASGCDRPCKRHFCPQHRPTYVSRRVTATEPEADWVDAHVFPLNPGREPRYGERLGVGCGARGWNG